MRRSTSAGSGAAAHGRGGSEGVRPRLRGEVEDNDPAVSLDANRRSVGALRLASGAALRPFRRGREPVVSRCREHGVEQHHAFECQARRYRSTVAAGGLADGVVQQPGVDQVEPCAVVDALDGAGVATTHEPVEEGVALRALGDAGNLRVCRGTQTPACRITSARNRACRSVKP